MDEEIPRCYLCGNKAYLSLRETENSEEILNVCDSCYEKGFSASNCFIEEIEFHINN